LDIENAVLAQRPDGSIVLPAIEAVCHGELKYESGHGRDNLGFWLNPADWAEFQFKVTKPGLFQVSAEVAAQGSGTYRLIVGDKKLEAKAPNTGDYSKFQKVDLGTLDIPAGKVTLEIRAVAPGWKPLNLKSLVLTPAK
jgi:hypothetical protein